MRRAALAIVFVLVVAFAQPSPAHAWTQPGDPVRAYDPPAHTYGPGHRGADFTGTKVRAVGAGTVTFAGSVAGARHVVVRHANGWRTSYGYLASITVARGQAVAEGTVVGTAGGTGPNHDGTVWHLGLRIGDDYADPMTLFDGRHHVHLVPVGEPDTNDRAVVSQAIEPVDYPILCRSC